MPGLREYLETHLEVPVVLGNPWVNFNLKQDELPVIDYNNAMRYVTALGLALKNSHLKR